MDTPNSGPTDEAQEKLFGESNSSGSKVEIKYFTDPKNGDTKIDISEVRQAFVGMGKEELMKFANNPFWVRMRWFLFVLFWLLWFGMLAGAIGIILLAPKCASPAPSKWYQESPIYHLNLKNFKDGSDDGIGDLAGLESKLDYFKDVGVETILLDPIMKTADDTEDIIDFQSIDPKYGTLNDLKKFVASAKEKGLHLLMKIIPNFSSSEHEWFNKSIAGEEPFKDYYVWTDPKYEEGGPVPRNNWLSVNGGPAWTYNTHRQQFYLHQFNHNQPDLNFRNPDVVKYFEEVYKFWIGLGFDGLYLDKVEYLVEDSGFLDEASAAPAGKIHDEYDFFKPHTRTTHLQDSWNVLIQWSEVFKAHSAIFTVSGVPDLKVADLIWRPMNIQKSLGSAQLENMLLKRLNKTSQAWEFSCEDCDERLRVGLQAALLMLPGAAVIPSGVELGLPPSSIFQWNSQPENHGFTTGKPWKPFSDGFENKSLLSEKNNAGSYFNAYKTIIKERKDPSILQGVTNFHQQKTVLAFTRSKAGSPQYLILLNLDDHAKTFNLEPFFGKESVKLTLMASTGYNSSETDTGMKKTFSEENPMLDVPGNAFVLYQYIPNSE